MKNLTKLLSISILILLLKTNTIFSQVDTVKYPIIDITFDFGMFYPRNANFQDMYNSKSNFNWSVGTRFGNSKWLLNTWIKYSQYKVELDNVNINGENYYLEAKRNQLSIGFVTPIRLSKKDFIQIKSGVSYNFITESYTNLNSEPVGFLFTIGYRKSFRSFSYYVDLGYDYARVTDSQLLADWSGITLCTGICLNIYSSK